MNLLMNKSKYIIIIVLAGIIVAQTNISQHSSATSQTLGTFCHGLDAVNWNPANLGYYGKPIILDAEKNTTHSADDSTQIYYSIQLVANPNKKHVKELQKIFHTQFGNNIPSNIIKMNKLYKLLVGDYQDRNAIEAFRDSVVVKGYDDAWIVNSNQPLEKHEQMPNFSLTLVGASLYAGNNSIYPEWINNKLFGNLDLREFRKKDNFLSVFPFDNWNINMATEINFMNFTFANFGVSVVQPKVMGTINLPTTMMDVLFYGVKFDQPQDLSALNINLLAASPISVDYGRELKFSLLNNYVDRFYAGVGLNILIGLGDIHVDTEKLEIVTKTDSVLIDGKTTMITNIDLDSPAPMLGTGFSLDLGVSAEINPKLNFSLALKDFLGKISWSERYITENEYSIKLSSEDIEQISSYNEEQRDSIFQSFTRLDTSYTAGSGKTSYPSQFVLGGSYKLLDNLIFHTSLRHYLNNDYLEDGPPSFSLGAEYEPTPVFPIYFGIGIGGLDNFRWDTDFQLNLGAFQWNIGFGQNGGIFNTSKGLCLSTDFRLLF